MKTLLALNLLLPLSIAAAQPPAGPPTVADGTIVQHWVDQLKSAEFRDQWYAAYALGMLGPKAAAAVPALHGLMDVNPVTNEYANEYSRSMAAWALGQIGPAAEPEIPFLIETMKATKLLAVRRSTAEALGNLGAAAKPAVDELLKMLHNDDEITRVNAAVALWKIDRHAEAVPALSGLLRQGNSSQTYAAAVALGQMAAEAYTVSPGPDRGLALRRPPTSAVRRPVPWGSWQSGLSGPEEGQCPARPGRRCRRLVIEARVGWAGLFAGR